MHKVQIRSFPFLDYIKDKTQRLPYIMSFGVHSWWSLGEIYFPIFLVLSGVGIQYVSIFLALWCIPPILMEMKVGQFARKSNYKYFFQVGFLGLFSIAIVCFFISNIWVVFWLLIISGIFASLIEPLQEEYFFSKTKPQNEVEYFPFFNTAKFLGPAFSRAVAGGFLVLLPDKFVYIVFAVIMLGCFLATLHMKN